MSSKSGTVCGVSHDDLRDTAHPMMKVYRGYLLECGASETWTIRDPWTGSIMVELGSGLTGRYDNVGSAMDAVDARKSEVSIGIPAWALSSRKDSRFRILRVSA